MRVVFLPGGVEKFKAGRRYAYEPGVLAQVTELCRDADLVGVSCTGNYLERARRQLCQHLKRQVDTPLIVDGIHPTVIPKACLEFADIVCRGDAVVMNPLRPPVADLDSLPFFDFSVQDTTCMT